MKFLSFYAVCLLILLTMACSDQQRSTAYAPAQKLSATAAVRILSYNIEYGAESYPLEQAIAVVKESRADVVVIQEARTLNGIDSGANMAAALGWYYIAIDPIEGGVVSRWPLELVDEKAGIVLVMPHNEKSFAAFYAVVVHLHDFKYQPFQAAKIPYASGGITTQEFLQEKTDLIHAAESSRGENLAAVLTAVKHLNPTLPVVVAGDYNEPSHLDWSVPAVAAGLCPLAVAFPASRRMYQAGFKDAYRALYPDEVATPGITWPTGDPGYQYRSDRIDFVYARTQDEVLDFAIYRNPSDHFAVAATIKFFRSTELLHSPP
jgi:endonuclease/exonuclease/phosphatase family metal-dependent hydrolase